MIQREVVEFVVSADWTDDCQVRLEVAEKVTELTITEATALWTELHAAIAEATRGAEELLHEVATQEWDVDA